MLLAPLQCCEPNSDVHLHVGRRWPFVFGPPIFGAHVVADGCTSEVGLDAEGRATWRSSKESLRVGKIKIGAFQWPPTFDRTVKVTILELVLLVFELSSFLRMWNQDAWNTRTTRLDRFKIAEGVIKQPGQYECWNNTNLFWGLLQNLISWQSWLVLHSREIRRSWILWKHPASQDLDKIAASGRQGLGHKHGKTEKQRFVQNFQHHFFLLLFPAKINIV